MNILEEIVNHKRNEVRLSKANRSLSQLKESELYNTPTRSLKQSINDPRKTGIIAEFKRRSPSKGTFSEVENCLEIVEKYNDYGASGISILTDTEFFGGKLSDLETAKKNVGCPLLRKDFIIDKYQIDEARAAGADVILLIAAILTVQEVKEFAQYAKELKLEILLEIHNESELQHICEDIDLVGVNNRDLKTFLVDVNESIRLSRLIPDQYLKVSESGIDSVATINFLKNEGFKGFLLGEKFMKEKDPGFSFKEFVTELKMTNEN